MSQIRDYVTSVELMIATGLDRHMIDHVLSYLTKFEKLMSMRPDSWIKLHDIYVHLPLLRKSKSTMYLDKFYRINRYRVDDRDMERYINNLVFDHKTRPKPVYDREDDEFVLHIIKSYTLPDHAMIRDSTYAAVTCIDYNYIKCLEYLLGRYSYSAMIDNIRRIIVRCLNKDSVECLIHVLDSIEQALGSDNIKKVICDRYYCQSSSDKYCNNWIECILLTSVAYNSEKCTDYIISKKQMTSEQ